MSSEGFLLHLGSPEVLDYRRDQRCGSTFIDSPLVSSIIPPSLSKEKCQRDTNEQNSGTCVYRNTGEGRGKYSQWCPGLEGPVGKSPGSER